MSGPPKFVQRVARLPEVLALVATYRDGITLGDLAARFGTDARTLREDLSTYLDLESWGWAFDVFRLSQVELTHPTGDLDDHDDHDDADDADDADDDAAILVRLSGAGSGAGSGVGLGVEHLAAGDLAMLYAAGLALLDVRPDDEALGSALGVIATTMYGGSPGATDAPRVPTWHRFLEPLREAVAARCRVRVLYSRAWHDGVLERDVEPLRLLQTHRGWELDAGPVGPEGNLRTYLLTHLRDVEPLDEPFVPPPGLEARLAAQRRTTSVRVELTHEARWAADTYAESVTVVDEDEDAFTADLELLPPVGERVALVLLASGPASRVLGPGAVLRPALDLVDELVRHHGG